MSIENIFQLDILFQKESLVTMLLSIVLKFAE